MSHEGAGERDFKIITLLGKQQVGKTSLALKWIEAYRQAHPRNPVIILEKNEKIPGSEFPAGAFADRRKLDAWCRELTADGKGPPHSTRVPPSGAMVVFDDCEFLPNHMGDSPFNELWFRNHHLCCDIIAIGHMSQFMPKALFAMSHEIWVFAVENRGTLKFLAEQTGIKEIQTGGFRIPKRDGMALRIELRPRLRITLKDTWGLGREKNYTDEEVDDEA